MPINSDNGEHPPDADLDLSDAELDALHNLQLGIEHVHRAYGSLLEFHHRLGHAMDRVSDAEDELREAGHEEWADAIRDDHLPAGAVSDQWTYELVEEFSAEFVAEMDEFETAVRNELADGVGHVRERRQQRRIRERAVDDG
ncbi:uncharacterized protein Nmag_1322 [Natrialba magadii ATCC 43099]|uniref:Uncharacterized protein n=1 Tax=Natrialba magadii (strain ATCC 43099 / DSM 3394 / CCM 3739 / CIP 104546 / IAM 13178 / JCM 8861 / NBRC 102185 / NCIMB 2190 / MS3) TaxID=547559 RepID=D3SSV5_NATMM|nr:hypothetical protein [Natrialba magadii]ADD04901.1 uncharacterized protein Nmag_1322 [Natrialba magadii ATCC 43099]ELY23950.1 hypothetical protein C500_19130 [Natrialba magadii ATCC 43099]